MSGGILLGGNFPTGISGVVREIYVGWNFACLRNSLSSRMSGQNVLEFAGENFSGVNFYG